MNFDFSKDPFENFMISLAKAKSVRPANYNAVTLSTSVSDQPSSRTVLFKGLRHWGFSFFTHYDGRKGRAIEINPHVSLTFYWHELDHQIHIIGSARKLSPEESDDYFKTRERLSQIGAWASIQSAELPSRETFEERIHFYEKKFAGQVVPRPSGWGGFSVVPHEIEFWFAHDNRLHERYIYQSESRVSDDALPSSQMTWRRFLRYP